MGINYAENKRLARQLRDTSYEFAKLEEEVRRISSGISECFSGDAATQCIIALERRYVQLNTSKKEVVEIANRIDSAIESIREKEIREAEERRRRNGSGGRTSLGGGHVRSGGPGSSGGGYR